MGKIKDVLMWPLGTDQGWGGEKPPKPPKIQSPEEIQAKSVAAAQEELRKRRRGGRGATILTGSLDTAQTRQKTLLGQ